jgi:hypothetical protein
MNIFRLAFELFALYLIYKLVFDFIIPVAKTTKQVKKQFNEMNSQMKEKMNQQPGNSKSFNQFQSKETPSSSIKDDYIDFEELK